MLRLFRMRIFNRILSLLKKERINQLDEQGNKHGLWRYYHRPDRFSSLAQITRGKLWLETSYVNGVMHGTYQTWYGNGQLSSKSTFVNGDRHGQSISYWDDGKLEMDGEYVNGIQHGPWVYSNSEGSVRSKFYFDRGNIEGEFIMIVTNPHIARN